MRKSLSLFFAGTGAAGRRRVFASLRVGQMGPAPPSIRPEEAIPFSWAMAHTHPHPRQVQKLPDRDRDLRELALEEVRDGKLKLHSIAGGATCDDVAR